jgi:hypothetical protein
MSTRSHPALETAAAASARLEQRLLLVLSAATGYYTYQGCVAIEDEGDWESKAGYALFALAVSIGLYLSWRAVQSQVPLLSSRRRIWLAAPIVGLICLFAIGTSTFYNLAGLIGEQAVLRHMELLLEQSSDSLALSRNQAHEGLEFASKLRLQEAEFKELAQKERDGGETSGTSGAGAITSMFGQVATLIAAAVREADRKAVRAEKLASESEGHLTAMRTVITDPGLPLAQKAQRFGAEIESLRLKLLELSRLETASDVRQATVAARNVIIPALSANSSVAASQRASVEALLAKLAQLPAVLEIAEDRPSDPLLGRPFEMITVYTAVLRHLTEFVPAVLAALLVDILPLPLLLLKILVYRDINRDDDSLSIARRFTVAEVLEVKQLIGILGLPLASDPHQRRAPLIDVFPDRVD